MIIYNTFTNNHIMHIYLQNKLVTSYNCHNMFVIHFTTIDLRPENQIAFIVYSDLIV